MAIEGGRKGVQEDLMALRCEIFLCLQERVWEAAGSDSVRAIVGQRDRMAFRCCC